MFLSCKESLSTLMHDFRLRCKSVYLCILLSTGLEAKGGLELYS